MAYPLRSRLQFVVKKRKYYSRSNLNSADHKGSFGKDCFNAFLYAACLMPLSSNSTAKNEPIVAI